MTKVTIREDRCKGCLLCAEICPKGTLAQAERFNQQGYKVVEVVDDDGCTSCAACAMICPDFAIRVVKPVTQRDEETAS